MSSGGPGLHVVLAQLLGALAVVATLVGAIVWLAAPCLARLLGPRARRLVFALGGTLLFAGSLALLGSRSVDALRAYGEELAFWLIAVGAGIALAAVAARRRLAG